MKTEKSEPLVVGIGASAGGLAALKRFFANVPDKTGYAFVVVVHLAPDHESHLSELLQPHVRFPVEQVTQTIALEQDHVYVIPPNANLNAIDTHLRLSELEERRAERAPIDHFFRTLASAHDGSSVAVVLTGTGSDGTLGIKDIKARGGLVIVQDPGEAEYDGMPQSAVNTGLVDLVLPLEEIPAAIQGFTSTQPRISQDGKEEVPPDERAMLRTILGHVRVRTDRDFSRYKTSTILRRIARRMQLNRIEELPAYAELLRTRIEEARALADDLLITVTSFFRDPEVFKKLEDEIVPAMLSRKASGEALRAWSVGCATGEEAYSLAMVLTEAAAGLSAPPQIQIFASDLHASSLAAAREGLYPADVETDVGSERIARFFIKENGGYRIRKEIRDLVVFAPHNILSDPPFSRMDLVSCRNLLIYLERDVQQEIFEIFHYALDNDGVMLLGTAESVESSDLFRPIDRRLCVFSKRNGPAREPRLPVFPLTRNRMFGGNMARVVVSQPEVSTPGDLHQRMVEEYAPPSILVGPDNQLIHLSQHAGRYMMSPGGPPTANVLKMVREELQLELQAALHEARERGSAIDCKSVLLPINGQPVPVVMRVRPGLEPEREGFVLVIFEDREAHDLQSNGAGGDSLQNTQRVTDLERQLAATRRHLQTVIEEYESGREEMSTSSEEMQSTNEELRSTLEELETSKEELQSINEELQTVNQQNRHKVDELAQLSNDLQNLLASTDIATLFLDRTLRILRFTPKLGNLFNIRISDRGRPIGDLTHKLGYSELGSDAETVLRRLVPLEREIQDEAGRWYLTRVLPYRSTEDRIEGVVITFIDIDARKTAEERVIASAARLQKMVNVDAVGILTFNESGMLIDANETFLKMSGYSAAEVSSATLTWQTMTPPEFIEASKQQMEKVAVTGRIGPYEKEYIRKDGSRLWMLFAGAALGDGTIIEYCLDVSDRKRAEQDVVQAKIYAERIIETLHEPLLVLTPELEVRSANPAFFTHFQTTPGETLGKKLYNVGNGQWDIPALRALEGLEGGQIFEDYEVEHTFEKLGTRALLLNARRLDQDQLILLGLRDITHRKATEKELRKADQELRNTNEALKGANSDLQYFSYAVSHDMQESLRMVQSFTQLLAKKYPSGLDDDGRKYIEFAVTGASRMERLLNDLRDYWAVREQAMEARVPVDCNDVVESVLKNLKSMIEESGAVVTHDTLPTVMNEENPLMLLFQNLISNALKYRRPQRVPEVHVSARPDESGWVFSVSDNGIGIDAEHFEDIFVPFRRLHKGEYPGSGLGLAMCRRVVERYGGKITVESSKGHGARFQFTIPNHVERV